MAAKKTVKRKVKRVKRKPKRWIQEAIGKPGALHKQLHVAASKNIPMGMLRKAAKKGGKLGHRARLALTLKRFARKRAKKE